MGNLSYVGNPFKLKDLSNRRRRFMKKRNVKNNFKSIKNYYERSTRGGV